MTKLQQFNQLLKSKGIPSWQVYRDRLANGDLSIKVGRKPREEDLAKLADRTKVYKSQGYNYGRRGTLLCRYIFRLEHSPSRKKASWWKRQGLRVPRWVK